MTRVCGLIMLTYAICPLAHLRGCVCVCVLQAAVRLRSTTASVGTAWLWGPMASPGSKSTPGRGLRWTLLFPQVRARWESLSVSSYSSVGLLRDLSALMPFSFTEPPA